MFTSKEFRRIARDKLKGHWGRCILVTLIACLLGGVGGGGGSSAGANGQMAESVGENIGEGISAGMSVLESMVNEFNNVFGCSLTVRTATALIAVGTVYALVLFIIGPAVELGHNKYYTGLILNNEAGSVGSLFDRFDIVFKALGLRLFMGLFILLWSLLFIIPGIIAAYRYSMAPYIMAENPDIGIREAVNRSKEMMKGHKGRLFCLGLSFIGWALLCVFTLGIGLLWLNPYMQAANAAFYVERTGRGIPLSDTNPQPAV